MKRPQLVHFLCIITDDNINVRASITMKENLLSQRNAQILESEITEGKVPIKALKLLKSYEFKMRMVGLDENHNEIYKKSFESDSIGNFNFKIPLTEQTRKIQVFQLYEVGKIPGLELHLGTFIPLYVTSPKKLVICDFDKTLLETKFSSPKELISSLVSPLEDFPPLENSLAIIKNYISKGHHPFILSASPHFYEDAMRDWLYKREIYSAGIFLKDYRKVLSFFDGDLTPKDLKIQGLYKLNHLLDILLMTGVPNELVLMGDNFESDPIIYLTLAMILHDDYDPWHIWNNLKQQDAFQLSKRQDTKFLNKIYQLNNLIAQFHKKSQSIKLKIFIRKKAKETEINVPDFFKKRYNLIELYDGNTLLLAPPKQEEVAEQETD